jgi:hypothetical protein
MPPTDLIRLRHMHDAAAEAILFPANRTSEDLASERVLSLALIRCIEIIGEAASKVTTETRVQRCAIDWFMPTLTLTLIAFATQFRTIYPPLIAQLRQILAKYWLAE